MQMSQNVKIKVPNVVAYIITLIKIFNNLKERINFSQPCPLLRRIHKHLARLPSVASVSTRLTTKRTIRENVKGNNLALII